MIEEIVRRISAATGVLLTSHANPDGDAIGSELGLARVLARLGKRVTIWNLHPVPTAYALLPGADTIHVGETPPEGFPGAVDLAVVLECPQLDRTGLAGALAELPLINIDHHLGNTQYGVAAWVDPSKPAVGVMVAELAAALDVELGVDAANCLFVALSTDTGGFRFANASPVAFEAAASLVRAGAEIETVSRWLYERQPEASVRLLGELLSTLRLHHGGAVATVHLTEEMFTRCGAAQGDAEGLIDTPRTIDGVRAVALLRDLGADRWKISLRSRGAIDVQAIALRHGGGGHFNAAGCRFEGTLEAAEERFVGELARAVSEAK